MSQQPQTTYISLVTNQTSHHRHTTDQMSQIYLHEKTTQPHKRHIMSQTIDEHEHGGGLAWLEFILAFVVNHEQQSLVKFGIFFIHSSMASCQPCN